MPMNWDLNGTELAKNRDKDKWHKEAWEFIFSNLNPQKPYTDEQGYKHIPMQYNLVWVLTTWTYSHKGGSYGDRGTEMLEGKYFVFEKEDIPQFKKDVDWEGEDKILEKLVGLKVWATMK